MLTDGGRTRGEPSVTQLRCTPGINVTCVNYNLKYKSEKDKHWMISLLWNLRKQAKGEKVCFPRNRLLTLEAN